MQRNARTSAVVDAIQRALNGVKDLEEGRRKNEIFVMSLVPLCSETLNRQTIVVVLFNSLFPSKILFGFLSVLLDFRFPSV